MMRKPDKASLLKCILGEESIIRSANIQGCSETVADGGALLHRVRWNKGTTFRVIAQAYFMYVSSRYNNCVAVFDGYGTISTKHHEHLRRNSVPQSSFVAIEMENEIPYQQDRYLSLEENKVELINFLSR